MSTFHNNPVSNDVLALGVDSLNNILQLRCLYLNTKIRPTPGQQQTEKANGYVD